MTGQRQIADGGSAGGAEPRPVSTLFKSRGLLARLAVIVLLLVSLVMPSLSAAAEPAPQSDPARQQARQLLEKLTPAQRVGQLFLVTFRGTSTGDETQIHALLTRYFVGGVVLRTSNDNFFGPENTAAQAHDLISRLQRINWQNSLPVEGKSKSGSPYIPLFIAIQQGGDSYPYDQIYNDLTRLPSQLSIGATWDPQNAFQAASILGKELSALGVNLLLGPSLDILEPYYAGMGEDLGTATFGGDPYWVSEMSRQYVRGLHTGSAGRLAVIATHFPGKGGSDRPVEEEVVTIRKSLEQLKQVELAPFFAITGQARSREEVADGLLVSHIRYQGFQGNIRATTRPVSFDPAALEALLKLPEFSVWRENGGLLISDDLGSKALRRFFDPNNQNFDARQIARNAFLAGNDLLFADNFIATGDSDPYMTITRTLDFFVQKYAEDPVFAQRVDQAVERILALKFRLYSEFSPENVLLEEIDTSILGTGSPFAFEIARQCLTLINPDPENLSVVLPRPPDYGENILFLTDVVQVRQCSNCFSQALVPVDAFQKAVARFYGPQAGGRIFADYLDSYSFDDLLELLNNPSSQARLEADLRQADWVIVASSGIRPDRPASAAFRRLLSERQDLLRNKKVIVFAFGPPFDLDSTDISKLTAYYGLFSKTPPNFEVAARALFQELVPRGALPVSLPAVGYDLIQALSPDPTQVIQLFVDQELLSGAPLPTNDPQQPTRLPPLFKVGDVLPIRTGTILDTNGHAVPDGTIVRFTVTLSGDPATAQTFEAATSAGQARATYRIQTPGLVEIRASSDPATVSQILSLDVTAEGGQVTAIAPTLEPTATSDSKTESTPTPSETPAPEKSVRVLPGILFWMLSLAGVGLVSFSAYRLGLNGSAARWGLRYSLVSAAAGMLVCFIGLLVTALTGEPLTWLRGLLVVAASAAGALAGWAGAFLWRKILTRA